MKHEQNNRKCNNYIVAILRDKDKSCIVLNWINWQFRLANRDIGHLPDCNHCKRFGCSSNTFMCSITNLTIIYRLQSSLLILILLNWKCRTSFEKSNKWIKWGKNQVNHTNGWRLVSIPALKSAKSLEMNNAGCIGQYRTSFRRKEGDGAQCHSQQRKDKTPFTVNCTGSFDTHTQSKPRQNLR